eukprot:COSAG01_NODE_2771_length_7101_cov_12.982148_4_plen_95_part_00
MTPGADCGCGGRSRERGNMKAWGNLSPFPLYWSRCLARCLARAQARCAFLKPEVRAEVSAPAPSLARSVLAEISLCHAWSGQEILRVGCTIRFG